ncbi:MAG: AcrR family transcriptional regulator [Parvibaculaceae bacterium]|jgi:AcrR family transcriptional regulator
MARPSLKAERREQILDAYENCVVRYGVEGATLANVADEAGIARPLIRHNVGNRDDLLALLIERFLVESNESTKRFIAYLGKDKPVDDFIEGLFDPNFADPHLTLMAEALIAASANNAELATHMQKWTRDFILAVQGVLAQQYPKAGSKKIYAVAAGLTGIYFNVASLSPLGPMPDVQNASKAAALQLAATLAT